MKKNILAVVLLLLVSSCSTSKKTDATIDQIVPESTTPIVSPALPASITVNGQSITIEQSALLTPGKTLVDAILIPPTDTFDTMVESNLAAYPGVKVIHVVPSLDTPVCSLQTRILDNAAKEFGSVSFMTISADLPFALKRFADANDIQTMHLLSDYKTNGFAKANGLFMPAYQLNTRAVMVVDENNVVRYVQYAQDVTTEINVNDVINFLRQNFTNQS